MTSAGRIRVVVADDHGMVRAGVRRLLEDASDIDVVGEADSGEQAMQQYLSHRPDILIMDLSMPGIGGLEAVRRILKRQPEARLLVLSMHEDVLYLTHAIQAGAKGYLTKRTAPEALLRAVREIVKGGLFLDRDVAQRVALHSIAGEKDLLQTLSNREFEVFRMLAEGRNVADIAEALFLSPKTVGTYQTRILQKLGVQNVAKLARLAIRKGLIQP
jgi:two-component system invasion response regulator UvrY